MVELARAHFGYEGHAAVGDGLAYVQEAKRRWDVILIDALTVDAPPAARARKLAIGLTGAAADLLSTGSSTLRLSEACARVRETDAPPPGFEGAGALEPVLRALDRCTERFLEKSRERHQGGKM